MEKNKIVKLAFKAHKMDFIIELNEPFDNYLNGLGYLSSKGVVKKIFRTKGGFVCIFEIGSSLFIPKKRLLYVINE